MGRCVRSSSASRPSCADGSVVRRLPGMVKDNTGYHLPSLLAGSEGTLAVVTRARLRLVPLLARRAVALLALEGARGGGRAGRRAATSAAQPSRRGAVLRRGHGSWSCAMPAASHRSLPRTRPTCWPRWRAQTDPTDELASAIEAAGATGAGRRDRGGRSGARTTVAAARAAHRGGQRRGHPAQAGRGRPGRQPAAPTLAR